MRLLSFDCIVTKIFVFLLFFGFYSFLECSVLHEGTKPEKIEALTEALTELKDKMKEMGTILQRCGVLVYTI